MRRSLAFIAVGVAVAVAAAIVIAGMSSGGGEAAGTSADPAGGALPSGHPSVAADDGGGETPQAAGEGGDGAVERLEARRAEDPGDVAVLLDLGEAYFMAQRLDDAEKAYTDALAAAPDSAGAQVGLAMILHARGDSRQAEKALHAVIEEHPDDQDAHYSLAIIYFSDGEIDAAKEQWQTAAGIDPESVTGRRSRSFVELLEDGQSDSPHASD